MRYGKHLTSYGAILNVSKTLFITTNKIKMTKYILFVIVLFCFNTSFSQLFKVGSIDIYGNRKVETVTILGRIAGPDEQSLLPKTFPAITWPK